MMAFVKRITRSMLHSEGNDMGLILLEGCDKTGKSTMAERLKACWENRYGGVEIIHRGPIPPGKDPMQEYWSELPDPEPDKLSILDRWHLGELVYGPLYRDRSKITTGDAQRIHAALKMRGALMILMEAPEPIVEQRFLAEGEDFTAINHIPWILARFHDMAMMLGDMRIVDSSIPISPQDIQSAVELTHRRAIDAARKVSHG
jgi:hypothetical protein